MATLNCHDNYSKATTITHCRILYIMSKDWFVLVKDDFILRPLSMRDIYITRYSAQYFINEFKVINTFDSEHLVLEEK